MSHPRTHLQRVGSPDTEDNDRVRHPQTGNDCNQKDTDETASWKRRDRPWFALLEFALLVEVPRGIADERNFADHTVSGSGMQNPLNQIKSLLLSHHHSTSALVSEILTSVLQTVQKTTIYIWTVHIYRLYRRQCAKYTYIYSVHIVYYKDILSYQLHIIHRMGTSTLCTLSIHYVVYT